MEWEPIKRALRAATFLIAHTLIAVIFVLSMFAVEALIRWLWGTEEPRFFGVIPIAYLFHAIDLGVLVVFGYQGILAAWEAFKE